MRWDILTFFSNMISNDVFPKSMQERANVNVFVLSHKVNQADWQTIWADFVLTKFILWTAHLRSSKVTHNRCHWFEVNLDRVSVKEKFFRWKIRLVLRRFFFFIEIVRFLFFVLWLQLLMNFFCIISFFRKKIPTNKQRIGFQFIWANTRKHREKINWICS